MDFSEFKKSCLDDIVKNLSEEGERAIQRAIATKTYEHDTYNLHDSYGSAVYVDGNIRLDSIRTLNSEAKVFKRWYNTYKFGKNELLDYLVSLKPSTKGVTLVVVAAMPYASVLEDQGGGLKHKYRVLSGARTDLEKIAQKYDGKLTRI